jgi:hypothetical protein
MKTVHEKTDKDHLFIKNHSGEPKIVLVFPVTRELKDYPDRWQEVIEFVQRSNIETLLVIDKTTQGSATDFFMNSFTTNEKRLIVLPRSIKDTLFDSVGEIELDQNMWIVQLHDDDSWSGSISLPASVDSETVYTFDFYLHSKNKKLVQILDFSMPNRIVFSLVPAKIWNRFSQLVRDENYHVAGSFDYTLNGMAQLSCRFERQTGFNYNWKDDNWDSRKNSTDHLTHLAQNDGWEDWSSPEIANFNRSIDSLVSLTYIRDMLSSSSIESEAKKLISGFKPRVRRKLKYWLLNPTFSVEIAIRSRFFIFKGKNEERYLELWRRRDLHKFIQQTWRVNSVLDLINLITYMQSLNSFEKLQHRFAFWKEALLKLNGKS